MPLTTGNGGCTTWNSESRIVLDPLHGATRRCSHPRYPAKLEFIDDFYFFIYLGSVISNEDGFEFKKISVR